MWYHFMLSHPEVTCKIMTLRRTGCRCRGDKLHLILNIQPLTLSFTIFCSSTPHVLNITNGELISCGFTKLTVWLYCMLQLCSHQPLTGTLVRCSAFRNGSCMAPYSSYRIQLWRESEAVAQELEVCECLLLSYESYMAATAVNI